MRQVRQGNPEALVEGGAGDPGGSQSQSPLEGEDRTTCRGAECTVDGDRGTLASQGGLQVTNGVTPVSDREQRRGRGGGHGDRGGVGAGDRNPEAGNADEREGKRAGPPAAGRPG
jgi:hypothetical protein